MNADMNSWYVLRVKPRCDKPVAADLRESGFEVYVATHTEVHQWSDRLKEVEVRLFPGYVFCQFGRAQRKAVLQTPGVLSVVSFGGVPAVVPDEEIAAVRLVASSGLPVRPCPYLAVGDRVTIDHGCLAGLFGMLVREKSGPRIVVSVTILQRSVEMELDRSMVSSLLSCADDRGNGTTAVA